MEKFNLDLSLVARLGGHSQPRTHRGKERFPGMTITYALIQMLEKARQLGASNIIKQTGFCTFCTFTSCNRAHMRVCANL